MKKNRDITDSIRARNKDVRANRKLVLDKIFSELSNLLSEST